MYQCTIKWILLCFLWNIVYFVDAEDECTAPQLIKLKFQLMVFFNSGDRGQLGINIFSRFLKRHPDALVYFENVGGNNIYSPKFKAHATRVLSGVNVNLNLLDDPEILHAQEAHLRERHIQLQVPDEFIKGFIRSLNEEMAPHIGKCFDRDLWKNCARKFFGGMMTGIDSMTIPRPG